MLEKRTKNTEKYICKMTPLIPQTLFLESNESFCVYYRYAFFRNIVEATKT